MKVTIKNLDKEFRKLGSIADTSIQKQFRETVDILLDHLVVATPIDTGLARRSWSLKMSNGSAIISHSLPYIDELNRGSSLQAPAFFIEKTALSYGKPKGSILN